MDATIDGRQAPLSGGPKSKKGSMCVELKQRSQGEIIDTLTIICSEIDGELVTRVLEPKSGKVLLTYKTEY